MSGFLDTNVIVRYLMNEPLGMAQEAARIIDGADALYVTDVVVGETAHVLSSFYLPCPARRHCRPPHRLS